MAGQHSPLSASASANRGGSDADKMESPQGNWSGDESESEAVDPNGGHKRKRPMSVSYVAS